jgi:hypothetical protein
MFVVYFAFGLIFKSLKNGKERMSIIGECFGKKNGRKWGSGGGAGGGMNGCGIE